MSQKEQAVDFVSRDFINPPIMISKNKKMIDVIEKLTEMDISRLIVHDSGKPIGIISTKDWIHIFLNNQNILNEDSIELTDIMHKIVYVDSMTSIKDCAKILLAKRISSLAIQKNSHIEGIFTKTDLIRFFASNYGDESKVSEYMTTDVISVTSDEPLYKVIRKMLDYKIPRIVVTADDSFKIITMGDFFRAAYGVNQDDHVEERVCKLEKIRENLHSRLMIGDNNIAKDIMSKNNLIIVNSSDSLKSACKIMQSNHIDAVGVIDENQKLCGILSKTDIMCAILSQRKQKHTISEIELTKSPKIKKSLNVLVVDDSNFSLNMYVDIFQNHGHKIETARNGVECIDAYNFKMLDNQNSTDLPFDVVILDYEMPGLKGNEVARRILNINPKQKITIISSWEIEKMQEEFSKLADYVELIEKGTPLEAIVSGLEKYA